MFHTASRLVAARGTTKKCDVTTENQSLDVDKWIDTAMQYIDAVLAEYLQNGSETISIDSRTREFTLALPKTKPARSAPPNMEGRQSRSDRPCAIHLLKLEMTRGEVRIAVGYGIAWAGSSRLCLDHLSTTLCKASLTRKSSPNRKSKNA